MKARLEAISCALDLAAAHVDCVIQGMDDPDREQAISLIPSPEAVSLACAEYRKEVRGALELARTLAALGK